MMRRSNAMWPVERSFSLLSTYVAANLMNKTSPKDTGGMHSLLAVHKGMRIRLLEHLDLKTGLVKDAEGEVVHIAINPADENEVREARAAGRPAYLRHLP